MTNKLNFHVDLLHSLIVEQKDYNRRVSKRLDNRYPTLLGKIFANNLAMIAETGEIHQNLKPYWQWWRGEDAPQMLLGLSENNKAELIDEHIDVLKFLLSNLILLGVDNADKLHEEYMKKHKIIHERLNQANLGNDDYLK